MALRREKKRIGDMLIEARVISQEQLEQALPRARETGKKIGETLIEMGFTNEEGIARALSEQLDMELVNLSNYYIEEDILKLVNENVLRKHIMIPYAFDSNNANIVHVAMADPMDMIALDDFAIVTNLQPEPSVSTPRDIMLALDKYYGDTFNEQYVKFPKHNEIVNWGSATAPDTIKVSLDSGTTTITVSNILGVMYDKDAVVATMDRSRFVNMYDQWNDRNVFKLAADRRYVIDPTENAIIYLNQ